MADPTDAEHMRRIEEALEARAFSVEATVLSVIADRLGAISPEDSVADALASMPADMARIESAAAKGASELADASEAAVASLREADEKWAAPYYAAAGVASAGAANAVYAAAAEEARNIALQTCDTSVMRLTTSGRSMPVRAAYVDAVTRAATAMARGEASGGYAAAAVYAEIAGQLCESGVRVEYASGRTRELCSAIAMNVGGTYRRAMHDARWAMGREFGADGVEISAHGVCAPDHLPYQGRMMSLGDYEKLNGELTRPLVDGANCRHIAFPVILGVSDPAYSSAELDALKAASVEKVTVTGLSGKPLTMTRYEASQYMRKIETAVRKTTLEEEVARRAGLPTDGYRQRILALEDTYEALAKDAELSPRRNRMEVLLPS